MNISTYLSHTQDNHFLVLLQKGDIAGFNHFYNRLYGKIFYRAIRRVKDELTASCIVQDAFLMLWLLRNKMVDLDKLSRFLNKQFDQGCRAFYCRSVGFYRSMVKLDDIENYQQFIGGYDPQDVPEFSEPVRNDKLDAEKLKQWKEVMNIVPLLSERQQLFIKFCLKYSFDYDQIAKHLGGISAYQVSKGVDDMLDRLKSIIIDSKKLSTPLRAVPIAFEGELTPEQVQIMTMRYQMNLCFEEIAKRLKLPQAYIQKSFIQGRAASKRL